MLYFLALAALPVRGGRLLIRRELKVRAAKKRASDVERLPVSGLNGEHTREVEFALKGAAESPDDHQVALLWIDAVNATQDAADMIVQEMDSAQQDLAFWQATAGNNGKFLFMLIRQGPVGFYRKLCALAGLDADALSAHDEMELKLSALRAVIARPGDRQAFHVRCSFLGRPNLELAPDQQPPLAHRQRRKGEELAAALARVHGCAMELRVLHRARVQGYAAAAAALTAWKAKAISGSGDGGAISQGRQLLALSREAVTQAAAGVAAELEALADHASQVRACPYGPKVEGKRSLELLLSSSPLGAEAPAGAGAGGVAAHPITEGGGAGVEEMEAALERAHALLEAMEERGADFREGYPLGLVPVWAERPSAFRQYWIRRTARWGAIALAAGKGASMYLSGELQRQAWEEHVAEPVGMLVKEAFETVHAEEHGIVRKEDLELSQRSLERMIEEFVSKEKGVPVNVITHDASSTAAEVGEGVKVVEMTLTEGMEVMMQRYEKEMASPVSSMVAGRLLTTMLIQVQKLKVDSESAMLAMDQLLRSNELNFALAAAMPAIGLLGLAGYLVWRLLRPRQVSAGQATVPVRLAMVSVERQLQKVYGGGDSKRGTAGGEHSDQVATGMLIYQVFRLHTEAVCLFFEHSYLWGLWQHRSSRDALRGTEWDLLEADLQDLISPAVGHKEKLATATRMARAYECLQTPVPSLGFF